MQIYKPFAALALVLLSGCALFNKRPPVTVRFHEEVSEALPDTRVRIVEVPGTKVRVAVDPFPQITEKDVYGAWLEQTPGGEVVRLRFDLHGANKLSEMTTRLRGRHIVVFVDDKPVAAVLVEKRNTTGEFLLEGAMSDEEQHKLVDALMLHANRHRDYGDTRYIP